MTCLFYASIVLSQKITGESGYVRSIERTDGVEVSQTLTKKLIAPGKPDVVLVGAAHIGTREYYTNLQGILDAQDVVLYEGVRSKFRPGPYPKLDAKGPKAIYQVLGDAIGLDFQLADINYGNPKWVNSDMTMEELERLSKKGSKGKASGFDQIEKMLDPNSSQTKMLTMYFKTAPPSIKEAMKIFLVEKLAKVDTVLASTLDPSTINVILTERNKSLETVFDKTISRPEPPKSIAIFYGAAHLPDVQRVLAAKYGYKPGKQEWFTFAKADRRKLDATGRQMLQTLDSIVKGLQ